MKYKQVLVTGADGFIGSHLTYELVQRGYSVRALVQYNSFGFWGWLEDLDKDVLDSIEIVSGDVRDPIFVNNLLVGIDAVLHLAALIAIPYSYISPKSYFDTNLNGTLNLLQASRVCGVEKFIHTSTSEVYGSAQFVPINESHPLVGQSPYSASKIAADQLCISYHRSFDMPVTILRPFNTYGPRQSARAVIPTIITQSLKQEKINLGDLSPTRDFNFISDTISGFVTCLETSNKDIIGEVINIGSGYEVSIQETANLIFQIMDINHEIYIDKDRVRPPKSEVQRLFCDNAKAKKLLNWEPKFSGIEGFKLGLKKTCNWFTDTSNLNKYKNNIYNV